MSANITGSSDETLHRVFPVPPDLPGEDWRDLVRAALNWPKVPRMLATSIDAEPEETFELGKLGVENFLHKMPEGGTFEETLRAALDGSEDGALERLGNLLAHRLGSESVRDVQADVRTVMVQKALERANGNRRQAARELGVSRQAVQQAVSVTKRRRGNPGIEVSPFSAGCLGVKGHKRAGLIALP